MKRKSVKKEVAKKRFKPGRYIVLAVLLGASVVFAHDKIDRLPKMNLSAWKLPAVSLPSFDDPAIEHVVFEGDFVHLSQDALTEALAEIVNDDFIRLDLKAIKKGLEEIVWVDRASVQRVWPATLKINVVEQKAIARWGNEGFINHYGDLIVTSEQEGLQGLPVLFGALTESYSLAKNYLTLASLFSSKNLRISGVKLSEDSSWEIEVNNAFVVNFGRRDLMGRVERFLYIYEQQLADSERVFSSVDMRYVNGAAIHWTPQDEAILVAMSKNNLTNNR